MMGITNARRAPNSRSAEASKSSKKNKTKQVLSCKSGIAISMCRELMSKIVVKICRGKLSGDSLSIMYGSTSDRDQRRRDVPQSSVPIRNPSHKSAIPHFKSPVFCRCARRNESLLNSREAKVQSDILVYSACKLAGEVSEQQDTSIKDMYAARTHLPSTTKSVLHCGG